MYISSFFVVLIGLKDMLLINDLYFILKHLLFSPSGMLLYDRLGIA